MQYFGTEINKSTENALISALSSGRFPHTVILEGGNAEQRLTLARHLAAALVCKSEERPCLICNACKKAVSGSHADISLYSPDSKGTVKNETAKNIVSSVGIIPNEADSSVFIIEEAHTLTVSAQNTLLKILEEPPRYAFFMLLCPIKTALLPTVISRAQVFFLGNADSDTSKLAPALDAAKNVMSALTAATDYEILEAAAVFEKDKELLKASFPLMHEIAVEAMKAKGRVSTDERFGDIPQRLASKLTMERLIQTEKRIVTLARSLERNGNYNLIITRICTLLRSDTK